MTKLIKICMLTITVMLTLTGCGTAAPANSPAPSPMAEASVSTPTPTPSPSPTPSPKKEIQWDTEFLRNDTGKTMIKCITTKVDGGYHTSFGIVSQEGTVILTDPVELIQENGLLKGDIVTVSHQHSDHYDSIYLHKIKDLSQVFQAPTKEPVTVKDVNVIGVAASHTASYPSENKPSNIIFIFEVDGLRIAHMGDMGQTELNPEQLEKIGQLDIVMTCITHAPQYGPEKEKNIRIIQQMNPKIVIPTHYSPDVAKEICEALGIKEMETVSELIISKDDLKDAAMRYVNVE